MSDYQFNQDQQTHPGQEQQQIIQQQPYQLGQTIKQEPTFQNQPFYQQNPQLPPQWQQESFQQDQQQNLQQQQQQLPLQPPQLDQQDMTQPPNQQNQPPKPQKKPYKLKLKFEELGVYRRAALGLLPNVNDPELQDIMAFSTLKSSRKYKFLDPKNLTVTLEGGYRLCRSTRYLPLDRNYFWEIDFTSIKNEESHVRIGIATIKADMEAPVGSDKNGYCIADLGKSFHNGWKNKKAKTPPFHASDTIGLGFMPGPESIALRLFVNGIDYGIIYDNISNEERWTPAISIYREAVVTGRFFRPFKFDPGEDWTAAGDIPRDIPDLPIIAKDLVKAMKGTMSLSEQSELYMQAIYAALTPAHQMPI